MTAWHLMTRYCRPTIAPGEIDERAVLLEPPDSGGARWTRNQRRPTRSTGPPRLAGPPTAPGADIPGSTRLVDARVDYSDTWGAYTDPAGADIPGSTGLVDAGVDHAHTGSADAG
jgi:hypothetical protein